VMIYAYALYGFTLQDKAPDHSIIRNENGFRSLTARTRQVLKKLGLDENPALYNRLMERLAWLEEDDIHLLHSVLNRLREFMEDR